MRAWREPLPHIALRPRADSPPDSDSLNQTVDHLHLNRECYICPGEKVPPEKFNVALVQMSCGPEPEQNLGKALERMADAAGRGAEVVCLPELFQTQYFCQREDHALFDLAEPIPGPASERLAAAARQHHVVVVASLFENVPPGSITIPPPSSIPTAL